MPFENATQLSNFIEVLFILLIPAALDGDVRPDGGQPPAGLDPVLGDVRRCSSSALAVAYTAEQHGSPVLREAGIEMNAADGSTGGNMQDKEQRFGVANSRYGQPLRRTPPTGRSTPATRPTPASAACCRCSNMVTGEVIFGGVGSGLYGMLLFVLLTVFIAGLMVGRTPEYLGKKIEAREMKLVVIGTIFVPIMVLGLTALAIATKYGAPSIFNSGPHGFSETLYAYTSQANNNGSAFAGYTGFVQPNAPGNAGASASRSPI